jgi:hypothetical protein
MEKNKSPVSDGIGPELKSRTNDNPTSYLYFPEQSTTQLSFWLFINLFSMKMFPEMPALRERERLDHLRYAIMCRHACNLFAYMLVVQVKVARDDNPFKNVKAS